MKKMIKATGLLCAAALTAAMGFSSLAVTDNSADSLGTAGAGLVQFDGTVVSVEEDRFVMDRETGVQTGELVVNVSEDTLLLDGVNGYPISMDHLEEGESVRVYVGPAMTMSLPPISNGVVVLADVPEDGGFPIYTQVKDVVWEPEQADGTGGVYVLTTADGTTYRINSSTVLLPYLTRNIIREQDLTPGSNILLWTDADPVYDGYAAKIVLFPSDNGQDAAETVSDGWEKTDGGWVYYRNGELHTGWLLDGGDWYYLNPETGLMVTGFLTLEGKTYYLQEDGRMLTQPKTFTPDENGVLHWVDGTRIS